jgi:RHS repeat-associated protein
MIVGGENAEGAESVNREEYTPYGETSFGSFGRKRYRFNGKERDEESGFYCYGLRYYAPWLARWTSCDPLYVFSESYTGGGRDHSLYSAFAGNPLHFVDPTGLQPQQANVDPKDRFNDKFNTLRQQGWIVELDPGGQPIEYEDPEKVGARKIVGETQFEYRRSIQLVNPHLLDPETDEPARIAYHEFEEVEPSFLQKVLRAVTPALEWLSFVPSSETSSTWRCRRSTRRRGATRKLRLRLRPRRLPGFRSASSRRRGSATRRWSCSGSPPTRPPRRARPPGRRPT